MNDMVRDQSSRETIRVEASSSSEKSPACASCKHQRKKCGRDCIMAPFFPAEKDSSFKEVHKLFGVSNIQKMIERLKRERNATEAQVADAIDAVKWVASSWERDPVSGCYGEYKRLEELCLRLQRQVSLCAFCTTAQTQSPLPAPAPQHHFNGAAINYWRTSTNNISPGTHYHQNSANRFANYNNQAVQISGYLDAAGGGRNLNPEIQVGAGPHPYLPLLDAADHSGLFPPGNNFRLPRTAVTSSSPALAAPTATYYHHLQDHQGRNGIMETKKAKELDEQAINWGSSSLP